MGAGPINPQMLMALLRSKAPGGVAGNATGAPGAGGGAEDSVGPAARELEGANPGYALQMITRIKQDVVNMIPTLAMKAPGAARALASILKGLDASLKELQQATATKDAVAGGPIKSSAIPQPQPPGGPTMPALPNAANPAQP